MVKRYAQQSAVEAGNTAVMIRKIIILFLAIISFGGMLGCSPVIIQYKPVSDRDTILMVGNYGGNDFFLKKNIVLKERSISLQIVSSKKNLSIVSYDYDVWDSDFMYGTVTSDELPLNLIIQAKENKTTGFTVTSVKFLDEKGEIHSLGSTDNKKTFYCWLRKVKHKKN